MDNGFLLLNKVRIPHINMMAKFCRVDPESSKYERPGNPALVYGTMTWVRANIVLQAGATLARGVTIATRYCTIRHQFLDKDAPPGTKGETAVLDYTMVQYRLLPLLAATFALHFTGKGVMDMYDQNKAAQAKAAGGAKTKQVESKSSPGPEETVGAGGSTSASGLELLADLHATSCGLKALGSTTAGEGLEVCRRTMGGHGYSSFSGVGSWYADYLPTLTWEGDNYMLTQQVARYLLKSARAVLDGKAPQNDTTSILTSYIKAADTGVAFNILERDEDLVAAYAHRAAHLTFAALKARDEDKATWNSLLVDFWRLSTAHSQYLVVKQFYEAIRDPKTQQELPQETIALLQGLFRLYALHTLENEAESFYSSAALTVRQLQLSRKAVMRIMEEIRPHAVRLVDVWQFSDWQLDSSLGRSDGKVYEDMFHRASEVNPLNKITVDPYPDSPTLFKSDTRSKL
jgi:acyl-CoA oxidase